MFDELAYCTIVEYWMLKILLDKMIIVKGSKICDLCILEGFNVVVYSSSSSEDFNEKNKL